MTPQVLLNCMLFRGVGYITQQSATLAEKLFILVFRGAIGTILLCFMANWANPNIQWERFGWLYILVALIGVAWANVFVWGALILIPMNLMGVLAPMWDAVTDFVIGFFMIIGLILWSIASGFQKKKVRY